MTLGEAQTLAKPKAERAQESATCAAERSEANRKTSAINAERFFRSLAFRERIKVRVLGSRARGRTLRAQSRARRVLKRRGENHENAWMLVKLPLVDKPSTPRERARRLRREQTEAERFLRARLRARQLSGAKFRRQCPTLGGAQRSRAGESASRVQNRSVYCRFLLSRTSLDNRS